MNNFSAKEMNRVWNLSNDAYPAILEKNRRYERRHARLKIRDTFCYQLCRALRDMFR